MTGNKITMAWIDEAEQMTNKQELTDLRALILCEIGDFFAGFGCPGEPETPEDMQRELTMRVGRILNDHIVNYPRCEALVEILRECRIARDEAQAELQERRKADSSEPVSFDELNAAVAEVTGCNPHAWDASIYKGHQAVPFMNYNSLARIVDKYRTPPALKDHQIRELVNDLRDIAVKYHGTQQLRERIARTVSAAMLNARGFEWVGFDPAKESAASGPECNCWRCQMVKILSGHGEVEK
ncbi:hypothetical protein [Citrobacter braakii]|uniref:hypothetical protein n=1 Tax=Citrobacter braakii TaxID=57706 RepID=UPI004039BD3A